MPFIYSTLSADVSYNMYYPNINNQGGIEPRRIKNSVLIKGGSSVAPAGKKMSATVFGIRTEVTTEELEFLKQDETFQTHLKNGFVAYSDNKIDPEKVIVNMDIRDESSPIMPEDNMEGDIIANQNKSAFESNISIPTKQRNKTVVNNIQ